MKYEINDIVNVHSYGLRVIGKIISRHKDDFGFIAYIVKDKNGKLFECCDDDIAIKF